MVLSTKLPLDFFRVKYEHELANELSYLRNMLVNSSNIFKKVKLLRVLFFHILKPGLCIIHFPRKSDHLLFYFLHIFMLLGHGTVGLVVSAFP